MDTEQIRVQVLFTKVDPETGLSYTDALYFDLEEYASVSRKTLDSLEKQRFDTWKSSMGTSEEIDPIKEVLPKGVK